MRIFDPKDQLGNAILSSADTQKSSVKLEKQMAVGGGAITLTSTDISDIENWELSNASVEVDGQMISFLPDTSRGANGVLTVDFGTYFPNAVLILKRTVFDGMKQEEEQVTIEVKIQRLMDKTLASVGKDGYNVEANVAEWQQLGREAYSTGDVKYANAALTALPKRITTSTNTVNDCFMSVSGGGSGTSMIGGNVMQPIIWETDLPSLTSAPYFLGSFTASTRPLVWRGKMPNLMDGSYMFYGHKLLYEFDCDLPSLVESTTMFRSCEMMSSFRSKMPKLARADGMFYLCKRLTSFQCDMPASLTTDAGWMFRDCKLDLTSVERISRTIAVCTGEDEDAKTIDLGVSKELEGDETLNGYIEVMSKSVEEGGKGWVVVVGYN